MLMCGVVVFKVLIVRVVGFLASLNAKETVLRQIAKSQLDRNLGQVRATRTVDPWPRHPGELSAGARSATPGALGTNW